MITKLWKALVYARAYGAAFSILDRLSDQQLAAYGVTRAEVWRAADRIARKTSGRALA